MACSQRIWLAAKTMNSTVIHCSRSLLNVTKLSFSLVYSSAVAACAQNIYLQLIHTCRQMLAEFVTVLLISRCGKSQLSAVYLSDLQLFLYPACLIAYCITTWQFSGLKSNAFGCHSSLDCCIWPKIGEMANVQCRPTCRTTFKENTYRTCYVVLTCPQNKADLNSPDYKPVQPFLFIALPQGMPGRVKGHMFLLGLYGNIAQL